MQLLLYLLVFSRICFVCLKSQQNFFFFIFLCYHPLFLHCNLNMALYLMNELKMCETCVLSSLVLEAVSMFHSQHWARNVSHVYLNVYPEYSFATTKISNRSLMYDPVLLQPNFSFWSQYVKLTKLHMEPTRIFPSPRMSLLCPAWRTASGAL